MIVFGADKLFGGLELWCVHGPNNYAPYYGPSVVFFSFLFFYPFDRVEEGHHVYYSFLLFLLI